MQTKTKLLFNLIVLVALVVSAIGCRSNGGSWYDVRSYSLYNPFRLEDHSHNGAPTVADNQPKPHMDPRVDIKQPEGGYSDVNAITQTGTGLNGRDTTQGYQRTTYHSDQTPISGGTAAPSGSYGGTASAYGGFGGSTVAPPITPSSYTQPSYNQPSYTQPTGLNQPSSYQQPMNDSSSLPNTYSVPQPVSGYPAATSSVPAGYPAATSYSPEGGYTPNPQDSGNYGGTTVASPFASPTGQPSAGSIPPSTYGVGTPNGYGNPSIDQGYGRENPTGASVYSGQPTGNPNSAGNPQVGYTANGAITTSSGGVPTVTPSTYK